MFSMGFVLAGFVTYTALFVAPEIWEDLTTLHSQSS